MTRRASDLSQPKAEVSAAPRGEGSAPRTLIIEVRERISQAVSDGLDLRDAASSALADVKARGQSDELLAEIGVRALMDDWQEFQHASRRSALGQRDGQPGQRKVNVTAVNQFDAICESRVHVNGRWLRVGDLTAEDCQWLSAARRALARANEQAAVGYAKIGRRIRAEQAPNLREAFKNDTALLVKLYREASDD